jgi:hypothetical protein
MNFSRRDDVRTDPRRLAAVAETRLVGTEVEDRFDRLTRVAAATLNVPAAFLSLVGRDSDFYKSAVGLPKPLARERTLTGETFCHFAIVSDGVLIIEDARTHPILSQVPTVRSLGIVAYLGVPLRSESGEAIGAFCAIDTKSHAWSENDIDLMIALARVTLSEIRLAPIHRAKQGVDDLHASLAPIVYALFLRILGTREEASPLLSKFMEGVIARPHLRNLPLTTASQAAIIREARTLALARRDQLGQGIATTQPNDPLPASLSELERRIVSLAYFDGLKIERIAEVLDVPAPQVKQILLGAIQNVRLARSATGTV